MSSEVTSYYRTWKVHDGQCGARPLKRWQRSICDYLNCLHICKSHCSWKCCESCRPQTASCSLSLIFDCFRVHSSPGEGAKGQSPVEDLSEGSPRSLFQCHCMGKNPASICGRFCQWTSTTAKWKFQGKQTKLRYMFYLALQYHRQTLDKDFEQWYMNCIIKWISVGTSANRMDLYNRPCCSPTPKIKREWTRWIGKSGQPKWLRKERSWPFAILLQSWLCNL